MKNIFNTYLQKQIDATPLAVLRIGFGTMMFLSIIRFWYKGWIATVYITPKFHFSYYGFEWIKALGQYTYLLFFLCGLSALCVAIGYKYRLSIILFFLSFTYIELIEKTTYLNHYYFISILSFLLIFLPAHHYFSMDNLLRKTSYKKIPKWTVDSIKLLLAIVYIYAGIAKINSDWLCNAMPLKIWLPSKYDLPILGDTLMQKNWFHYAMSWSGMLYDICIPFLLMYKPTRWFAFAMVVFFHVFTRILFPIGMFPYIMIVSAMIFFESKFHLKIINFLKKLIPKSIASKSQQIIVHDTVKKLNISIAKYIIVPFFILQLLLPFRYLLYPGELFWTEEGYRFSWRVMLMEKMGYTQFLIKNADTGASFFVNNEDFLSPLQEKQMSFQPDFILEYAHYLGDHFTKQGHSNVQVFAHSHVALNGRPSQLFIDKNVDLYKQKESLKHKDWILPFEDEIKGL